MFIRNPYDYCEIEPSDFDRTMIGYAQELGNQAKLLGEVPVGAVIVNAQGSIIGEGFNRSISDCDPSAHAEINALRNAGKKLKNYRLSDLILYVNLEPCAMCAGAIVHSRISRVVFGALDAKTGALGSRFHLFEDFKMNHIPQILGGVLKESCSQQLTDFFRQKRKKSSNSLTRA